MGYVTPLSAYLDQRAENEKESLGNIQQAGALQTMLSQAAAQQREAKAREIMASNASPEDKFTALAAISPQHAHQFASGLKEMAAMKAQQGLQGADINALLDNPQAALAAQAANPHIGPELERLRKVRENRAALNTVRGEPAAIPAGTPVADTGAETAVAIPPEERDAFQRVAQASAEGRTLTSGAQPGDTGRANPELEALMRSDIPTIANRAITLNSQLQRSGDALTAKDWLTRIENLSKEHTTLQERKAAVASKTDAQGPGGVGSKMYQDPQTGQKYLVGKTGNAFELADDGTWKATNPNNLPKTLTPVGNIGTAGSREAVFSQRMIQAGNQISKDLENVVQLPMSSSRGPFGAFGSVTHPSFMDAGKSVLGNAMTTQEQQTYNAMATGFQRTLAAIEASGLMPGGKLSDQMDAVIFKPGDTNLTKLHKLAQTRQIAESGMEVVLANPRISDDEKKKVTEIVARLQKAVPFTHSDLIELSKKQAVDPDITLRDVVGKKEDAATPKPASGALTPAEQKELETLRKRFGR